MTQSLTCAAIVARLEEQKLDYSVIRLQNSYRIIVTKRGGRVFGPFESDDSEGVLWVNQAFGDGKQFADFIAQGIWNLGGDRIWVAPEIPMFTRKRSDFFGTTYPQPELDPGSYTLETIPDGVKLEQHVAVDVFESDIQRKAFYVGKELRPAADPLRQLKRYAELIKDVSFCGYQQTVTVTDESPESPQYLEAWNLCQVVPGGLIYTPFNGEFEFVDYYRPVENMQTVRPGLAVLKATGDRQYKVGYPSAIVTGRAAYVKPLADGQLLLFVKNYFNNPSSVYSCEPFDKPGEIGCSLFVYNDDGDLGGFTEFENTFQTVGGDTQLASTTDSVQNWFYYGAPQNIARIAKALVGIDI